MAGIKRKILKQAKLTSDIHGVASDYDVSKAQTEGFKLEDTVSGKPIILRRIEFVYPPGRLGRPTKDQIFTEAYLKNLNDLLMMDGMELIQEPRIVYNKKGFDIFCTCQVKRGNIIPRDLQDQFNKPIQEKLQDEGRNKVL